MTYKKKLTFPALRVHEKSNTQWNHRERERDVEGDLHLTRGKRYSVEKTWRQGEGKIKEERNRTQNRMRREGQRGKETRESKYRQQQRRGNESKDRAKENGLNLPLEYQTRNPDEVYRTILCSQEMEASKCALVKAESATSASLFAVACQSNVVLYYAKRLEDIGVILGIVFCQITSQLSVSSRTLVLSRSRHVKATGWQCREWENAKRQTSWH